MRIAKREGEVGTGGRQTEGWMVVKKEREKVRWRHRIVEHRVEEEEREGAETEERYSRRGVHYSASMGTQTTAYLFPFQ